MPDGIDATPDENGIVPISAIVEGESDFSGGTASELYYVEEEAAIKARLKIKTNKKGKTVAIVKVAAESDSPEICDVQSITIALPDGITYIADSNSVIKLVSNKALVKKKVAITTEGETNSWEVDDIGPFSFCLKSKGNGYAKIRVPVNDESFYGIGDYTITVDYDVDQSVSVTGTYYGMVPY